MNPSSAGTHRNSWGFAFPETGLSIEDDVLRASARALIRVLSDYRLDRESDGSTDIWKELAILGQAARQLNSNQSPADTPEPRQPHFVGA